ncbi:YafY family protein [Oscillatoria sp. HE19RPO]|uniref:helix-turn-helix transcriptional regulator n=1 Tax=Oscillatoria sp. HE19RPO TaxID=2954806 RepID=UPI0020C25A6D|nr:WYL domain-containing protein [Oscillatoria sp. HE19RPO]
MAKKPTPHPYSDRSSFERLMLLIATLVQYPGVGHIREDEQKSQFRDALQSVQEKVCDLAASLGIELPPGYPATATLRKDLERLRDYGILDRRIYRWGYYLGTGVMNTEQLQVMLCALESQGKYQGNPQARQLFELLSRRLRGLELETTGQFSYPVRQHLNRAIMETDPLEIVKRGKSQNTLFHQQVTVEQAIASAQAIELSRKSDPYGRKLVGLLQIWPLQLVYHDIAWYLIYEYCESGHLAIGRFDRFGDYCKVLTPQRTLEVQSQSLKNAHQLLENGWGLYLGEPEEQQAELAKTLKLETVKVRFFNPVTEFIREGDCRHPRQKIKLGPKNDTGKIEYLDYLVPLPRRSFQEFMLWVYRYMNNAIVLSPPELAEQHQQAARKLVALWD